MFLRFILSHSQTPLTHDAFKYFFLSQKSKDMKEKPEICVISRFKDVRRPKKLQISRDVQNRQHRTKQWRRINTRQAARRASKKPASVVLHGAGNFWKREFSLCSQRRYPETITASRITARINNSRQTTSDSPAFHKLIVVCQ